MIDTSSRTPWSWSAAAWPSASVPGRCRGWRRPESLSLLQSSPSAGAAAGSVLCGPPGRVRVRPKVARVYVLTIGHRRGPPGRQGGDRRHQSVDVLDCGREPGAGAHRAWAVAPIVAMDGPPVGGDLSGGEPNQTHQV